MRWVIRREEVIGPGTLCPYLKLGAQFVAAVVWLTWRLAPSRKSRVALVFAGAVGVLCLGLLIAFLVVSFVAQNFVWIEVINILAPAASALWVICRHERLWTRSA